MDVIDSARAIVLEQLRGNQVTSLLYVAAKLGIPDLLAAGPRSSGELAVQVNAHPLSLHRVLHGLVAVGILRQERTGHFALTDTGSLLRRESPQSLWDDAILAGELMYRTFGALLETVATGRSGTEITFGMPLFELLSSEPELGARFDGFMGRRTQGMIDAILDAYDFAGTTIVDVGGGTGGLVRAILKQQWTTTGVLVDLPSVAERARLATENDGLAQRCRVVGIDFFAEVPPGGDVYVLKHVIHDWDDAASLRILGNCRAAMQSGGRLLVIETVLPERVADAPEAIWLDLRVLANLGSRERTVTEYRDLLDQAGFELRDVLPTASEVSILAAQAT